MPTSLVSVVMPAFNQERWIDAAVDSVLTQRDAAFELVVVDDGSTDGTRARLEGLAARAGDRLRIVHQPNRGASAARNAGVSAARGELIAFCDADDVQHPERLAVTTAVAEQMPDVAFVATDFSELHGDHVTSARALHTRWIGPTRRPFAAELRAAFGAGVTVAELGLPVDPARARGRVYRGRVPGLFARVHFAWAGALLVRRSAFLAAGGFDERLATYEDWALTSRIAKTRTVAFVDLPTFLYRSHAHQATKRPPEVCRAYLAVAEQVWRADPESYRLHRAAIDRALGSAHWQLGLVAVAEGDWARAERHFRASVAQNPRQRRAYADLVRAAVMRRIHASPLGSARTAEALRATR